MLTFLIKAKDIALDVLFLSACLNCQKYLEKEAANSSVKIASS